MTPKKKSRAAEVKASRSKDTVSRSVRGAVQFSAAEIIVRFGEAFFIKLSEDQHIALLGMMTLLVTLIQNVAENAGWIPSLMKKRK